MTGKDSAENSGKQEWPQPKKKRRSQKCPVLEQQATGQSVVQTFLCQGGHRGPQKLRSARSPVATKIELARLDPESRALPRVAPCTCGWQRSGNSHMPSRASLQSPWGRTLLGLYVDHCFQRTLR